MLIPNTIFKMLRSNTNLSGSNTLLRERCPTIYCLFFLTLGLTLEGFAPTSPPSDRGLFKFGFDWGSGLGSGVFGGQGGHGLGSGVGDKIGGTGIFSIKPGASVCMIPGPYPWPLGYAR
jgi:hypothetical protein